MVRRGSRAPWDLFRFTGSPAEIVEGIRRGESPWFFASDGKGAFFRPLPSLGHWIEYRWLGEHHWFAHVHNLVWFAILIATIGWVFRLFEDRRWTAGLATIVFVCSPATAVCAAWIAARNSLMATAFGFAALGAHHLWRTKRRLGPGPALALLLFALGSGESSAGPLAYLIGYAAFLDRGSLSRRLLSVTPYVLLAGAWYGIEHSLGYGSAGNLVYRDMNSDPFELVPLFAFRVVKLIELELGWTGIQVLSGRFEALNGSGTVEPGFAAMVYFCASLFVVGAVAVRERTTRFWLVSALASLAPFCFAMPQPRLLLTAHVGMSMALARGLRTAATQTTERGHWPKSLSQGGGLQWFLPQPWGSAGLAWSGNASL